MEEESAAAMMIEFLLLQPNIGGKILKPILTKFLPIHKNDPRIIQAILLRQLSSSISENTLDVLEKLEEDFYYSSMCVLDSMKQAYCAVAVHCTVMHLKHKGGGGTNDLRGYFEAVIRIWRGRVCDRVKFGNVGLVSSKLIEMKSVIEEVIWDANVRNNVLKWDTLGDAVRLVGEFLSDAYKEFGECRLEIALKEMMMEKGNVASRNLLRGETRECYRRDTAVGSTGGEVCRVQKNAECDLALPQSQRELEGRVANGDDMELNSVANAECQLPSPQVERAQDRNSAHTYENKNVIPTNFELLEESPSPKNFCTWETGATLSEGKWLIAKNLNFSCGPSSTLTDILKTPMMPLECANSKSRTILEEKTQEKVARKFSLDLVPLLTSSSPIDKDPENSNAEALTMVGEGCEEIQKSNERICLAQRDEGYEQIQKSIERLSLAQCNEGCEEIQKSIERLSLAQCESVLDDNQRDPFTSLLRACKQSAPSTLLDLFSQYCDPDSIEKIGEGTFGEVFKAGRSVCKIVPIDGDLVVNGEVQKRSIQLLEEVLLSWALNSLKGQEGDSDNTCATFIETIDVRVCQGLYDASLIKVWEDWRVRHKSGNDLHPKEFSGEQCYLVFVLANGGEDLESFELLSLKEAHSLLVQVAAALAVAEAAYEFEHRDLHWGNILLTRRGVETEKFVLEGRQMWARTFGLFGHSFCFVHAGEAIHYLDLSTDPALFGGPKDCKQSETYRKMRKVTDERWEGSFPQTNLLWLQYLIDILLQKKSFSRSSNDERDLRSLRKRLGTCCSAREAIADPFFSNLLLLDHDSI